MAERKTQLEVEQVSKLRVSHVGHSYTWNGMVGLRECFEVIKGQQRFLVLYKVTYLQGQEVLMNR